MNAKRGMALAACAACVGILCFGCPQGYGISGGGSGTIEGNFCGDTRDIDTDQVLAWASFAYNWQQLTLFVYDVDEACVQIVIKKPWLLASDRVFTAAELGFVCAGDVVADNCGTAYLYPSSGTITIAQFDGDCLSGTFDVSADGQPISGSFDVAFDATVAFHSP